VSGAIGSLLIIPIIGLISVSVGINLGKTRIDLRRERLSGLGWEKRRAFESEDVVVYTSSALPLIQRS
jgi:hypothetical protein